MKAKRIHYIYLSLLLISFTGMARASEPNPQIFNCDKAFLLFSENRSIDDKIWWKAKAGELDTAGSLGGRTEKLLTTVLGKDWAKILRPDNVEDILTIVTDYKALLEQIRLAQGGQPISAHPELNALPFHSPEDGFISLEFEDRAKLIAFLKGDMFLTLLFDERVPQIYRDALKGYPGNRPTPDAWVEFILDLDRFFCNHEHLLRAAKDNDLISVEDSD